MMHRIDPAAACRRLGCGLILPLLAAMPAWAAPQSFNTALPVAQTQWLVRIQSVYAEGDLPALDGRARVAGALTVAGYGVTGDLTLFAALPVLHKRLATDGDAGRTVRKEAGVGDLRLFARQTLYKRNLPGRTLRLAAFAGAELPTGRNGTRDRLGLLPAFLQPGSGGTDAFFGTVATWQTLAVEVDFQIAYEANSEADAFEPGDVFRADASFQYRLWPRDLGAGVPGFLYGVLEANFTDTGRSRRDDRRLRGTGGSEFGLAPGIQYVTRRWVAEALVQLPVARDLGPQRVAQDVRVLAGIRFTF